MAKKEKLDPDAKVRNRGDVVFPAGSKDVTDNKDHFPINDKNQARNALSRVAQYSTSPSWYKGSLKSLQNKVRRIVKRKYSDIDVTGVKDNKKSKASHTAMLDAEKQEGSVVNWIEYVINRNLD